VLEIFQERWDKRNEDDSENDQGEILSYKWKIPKEETA